MPCKGAKAPRREGGPEFATVTIELNRGENDPQNVDYHATLLNAWKTVEGHPMFTHNRKRGPSGRGIGRRTHALLATRAHVLLVG